MCPRLPTVPPCRLFRIKSVQALVSGPGILGLFFGERVQLLLQGPPKETCLPQGHDGCALVWG